MTNGIQFFQTRMGRIYYEHTLPELVKALKGIAENLDTLDSQLKETDKKISQLNRRLDKLAATVEKSV